MLQLTDELTRGVGENQVAVAYRINIYQIVINIQIDVNAKNFMRISLGVL